MRIPALITASIALLVVAGCGGGEDPAAPEASATANASSSELPAGTAVPELLSGVRCEESDGAWSARGSVKNPTDGQVSYQVTAQVGPVGTEGPAATKRLDDVEAGSTVSFELTDIATSSPDGPCHLQLLALPGDA